MDIVQNFTEATALVFQYFRCPAEYLLKPLTHVQWRIWEEDGIFFLSYRSGENVESSLIVARKNDRPLVYESKGYTLVIAIDCVKIGFILFNGNKMR